MLMKLVIKVYCGWPVDTTSHILVDNGSQGRRKKCIDFLKKYKLCNCYFRFFKFLVGKLLIVLAHFHLKDLKATHKCKLL